MYVVLYKKRVVLLSKIGLDSPFTAQEGVDIIFSDIFCLEGLCPLKEYSSNTGWSAESFFGRRPLYLLL